MFQLTNLNLTEDSTLVNNEKFWDLIASNCFEICGRTCMHLYRFELNKHTRNEQIYNYKFI